MEAVNLKELLELQNTGTVKPLDEWAKDQCNLMNSTPGKLKGYDCPLCLNRGYIYEAENGTTKTIRCNCMPIRKTLKHIAESGFGTEIERCTFDTFKTETKLTKRIKELSVEFVELVKQDKTKWLYVGGQSGAGKTHICTAITCELLKSGKTARYMVWIDDSVAIKAVATDDAARERLINPLKNCDVLYIDDLFKPVKEKDREKSLPSGADIRLAFEIINYRSKQPQLITIISSELALDEILEIDKALGGRINEKSEGYIMNIPNKEEYNYRLRKDDKG